MITINKYNGAPAIPQRIANSDEPSKIATIGEVVAQKQIEIPIHRQEENTPVAKQKKTLRDVPEAREAMRRMLHLGTNSGKIIESIKKNFNINVYPADLSKLRQEEGIPSKRTNFPVKKPSAAAPTADAPGRDAITPMASGAINMATLIKMLSAELRKTGIHSVEVMAMGPAKINLGN